MTPVAERRPYRNADDLARLQAFNAAAIRDTGGLGYLHPGDIPHHLFSGNRQFDPADVLSLWESDGQIAAWALAAPAFSGADVQVRPDLRRSLEAEVQDWADTEIRRLQTVHGIERDFLEADVWKGDDFRADLLRSAGYEPDGEPPYVLNQLLVADAVATAPPPGFTIRPVSGLEEAGPVAGVHAAAFGSSWTGEMYAELMTSPGHSPERELVAVAPDGSFAAFVMTWQDPVNRIGLLEPVGVHEDYRRMGLGRAIVAAAVEALGAAGMETVWVANFMSNEASAGLYRSCGFLPLFENLSYIKRFTA